MDAIRQLDRFMSIWQMYIDDLDAALVLAGREHLALLTVPPLRRLMARVASDQTPGAATAQALLIRAIDDIHRCVREPGAVPDDGLFALIDGATGVHDRVAAGTRDLLRGERELRRVLTSAPPAETVLPGGA